jgi:hypothetical protein
LNSISLSADYDAAASVNPAQAFHLASWTVRTRSDTGTAVAELELGPDTNILPWGSEGPHVF